MNLIVLTCRNGRNLTRQCLPTLLAQTVTVNVLILDNASHDGTSAWARGEAHKQRGRILVSTFPFPLSVAELWNFGARFAWDAGADEVMIVNNDTEILPETYRMLSLCTDMADNGLVSCISHLPGVPLTYSRITWSPHPDFSCFMIRKTAWEAIGGFDENCKVAHVEDCCAHVELHRHGIKAVSISLPFAHHRSATMKHSSAKELEVINQAADANREYFYRKYGKRVGTRGYADLFMPKQFGRSL